MVGILEITMGRLNQLIEKEPESFISPEKKTGGRLSQALLDVSLPSLPPIEKKGFFRRTAEDIGAFFRGEVPIKEVAKEVPAASLKVAKGFAETFIPAITNFFKTTGSIFGEGLAYAVDKNVREQFEAGNLEILPTISSTTQPDLAKDVIAAGIETAVYRSFPQIIKMKLLPRGGAGALQGIGFAIAEGLANDKSPEEIIKSLPAYGVFGGTIGAISPYLLPVLKAEIKAVPKEIKNIFKGLQREVTQGLPPGTRKLEVIAEGAEEVVSVPIRRPEVAPVAVKEITKIKPSKKFVEVPREQLPVRPIKGMEVEAEKGVSALESRMKGLFERENVRAAKAEAEARGLDISIYDKMSKPEQLRMAAKYVTRTSQREVLEVLEGKREAPKGLLHNAIMIALEEKSLRDSNVNLAIKLASLRSTRAGQEISILTEVEGISPVSAIDKIIRARAERAGRRLKIKPAEEISKQVKQVSTELTQSRIKIAEAERILADIVC